MTRRAVLTTLAGVATAAVTPRIFAAPAAAAPAVAPSSPGQFRHSVCKWCYNDIPLETLAQSARQLGLESIELLNPADWPILKKYGLTCALGNGVTRSERGFNRVENHAEFVPRMIARIKECGDAGVPNVICFCGYRGGMSEEQGLENCVVGLKQVMSTAEESGVTVLMEAQNNKLQHKDAMFRHTAWGVELVKRIGSERFKLIYDVFHMQIMEGDVINTIRENHPYIAHYHTGGNPGRHEIDETQELNYPAIMRAIKETGFKGFVAQEFVPTRDPLTSLGEAIKLCSV